MRDADIPRSHLLPSLIPSGAFFFPDTCLVWAGHQGQNNSIHVYLGEPMSLFGLQDMGDHQTATSLRSPMPAQWYLPQTAEMECSL